MAKFHRGVPSATTRQAQRRAALASQRAQAERRVAKPASVASTTRIVDPIERLLRTQSLLEERAAQARRLHPTPRRFDPLGRRPEGIVVGEDGSYFAAPSPTSGRPTTPRTMRIGYDASSRVVRVLFRDGTPWNYYDVPASVARDFRRVQSPGQFINRTLNNFSYGRAFDWDPEDVSLGIDVAR